MLLQGLKVTLLQANPQLDDVVLGRSTQLGPLGRHKVRVFDPIRRSGLDWRSRDQTRGKAGSENELADEHVVASVMKIWREYYPDDLGMPGTLYASAR